MVPNGTPRDWHFSIDPYDRIAIITMVEEELPWFPKGITTILSVLCPGLGGVAYPREIGILLPNDQRQHRTLHIQKYVVPYALR